MKEKSERVQTCYCYCDKGHPSRKGAKHTINSTVLVANQKIVLFLILDTDAHRRKRFNT